MHAMVTSPGGFESRRRAIYLPRRGRRFPRHVGEHPWERRRRQFSRSFAYIL